MLDANAVSDFIKFPTGAVANRLRIEPDTLSISIIVAAEVRYGATKRASPRLSADVERVLDSFNIEPLTAPLDRIYADLRSRLESYGWPMAANDLLIAAHALTLGRRLVTRDTVFGRVPGLTVEDWTAPDGSA